MGVEEGGNFLGTDWDPLLLVNQSMDFNGSVGLSSYNVGVTGSQGMISSSTGRIEHMPRPSYLGSDRFSEAVSSVPLPSSNHSSSAQCPPDFPTTGKHSIEKNLKAKKRKGSPLERIQNNEAEQQKNASSEALKSPIEKDEKMQKTELNPGANSKKPTAKHSKEDSQNCDTAEEDYIHMRAKRGQATNSHSLAERVRREKISERMRVLQDLVPGCNKITGKAVMLDEIINYVQSLQRQVEFLSMKLAAINPELSFDVEQILSKDVFYIREGSSTVLGFSPPMSNPNPQFHDPSPHGLMQPAMLTSTMPNPGDMFRAPTSHISSMAHISNVWGHELQNIVPMNFIPNPPLDTKEATGKYPHIDFKSYLNDCMLPNSGKLV